MLNSNCASIVMQDLLLNHNYTKAELASLLDLSINELDTVLLESKSSSALTRSSKYLIEKHAHKNGIKLTTS